MLFNKRIEIDPVRDNLVNRVASGAYLRGSMKTNGGMLVQGTIHGETLEISNGPLVLHEEGVLLGKVTVLGDCYIFGRAGDENLPNGGLELEVHGTVHVAKTARTFGTIACQHLATYAGGAINSVVRSIPVTSNPPQ